MDKIKSQLIEIDYQISQLEEGLSLWFKVEELSERLEELKNA